jgi:hypothetical protein
VGFDDGGEADLAYLSGPHPRGQPPARTPAGAASAIAGGGRSGHRTCLYPPREGRGANAIRHAGPGAALAGPGGEEVSAAGERREERKRGRRRRHRAAGRGEEERDHRAGVASGGSDAKGFFFPFRYQISP